jgi:hypothetical protein
MAALVFEGMELTVHTINHQNAYRKPPALQSNGSARFVQFWDTCPVDYNFSSVVPPALGISRGFGFANSQNSLE